MINKTIKKVSVKDKPYIVNKFKDLTDFALGTSVCVDRLDCGINTTPITDGELNPTKIFFENGVLYYFQDGSLFRLDGGGNEQVYTATDGKSISVIGLNYKGKESVLIVEDGGKGKVITDIQTISVNLPNAEYYQVLGMQIFLGNKRELLFGECYDLSGFDKPIVMPISAGEIKGLIPYQKKLLIFCENAIYQLTPFGEETDYILERKTVIDLEVLGGSAKRLGESVVFISENKIFRYTNGNLTQIKSAFNLSDFSVCKNAGGYNNLYLLPVMIKGKIGYYLYAVDLLSGDEYLEQISSPCVADGGYLLVDGKVCYITVGESQTVKNCKWVSKPINFSSAKKKNLSEITLNTETPVKLTVSGGFGKKALVFKKGQGVKKVNLTAQEFVFTLDGQKIEVNEIGLKYRETGEL